MFGKINDAVETVKIGLDAQIALATAEQKELLADAKLALADIKTTLADLKDENNELKRKNDIAEKISYKKSGAVCFEDGLYCGGCYGKDDKLLRLKRVSDTWSDCPSCKAQYNVKKDAHTLEQYGDEFTMY